MAVSRATSYIKKQGLNRAVQVLSSEENSGVIVSKVKVADGYHTKRYKPERYVFGGSAKLMNRYLEKRQHLSFAHSHNLAKKFLYALPSFRQWSKLIDNAGSQAMRPLHDPEVKRLATGHRIDPVTRRLFRHGADPIGIRTRALTGGWLASQYEPIRQHQSIVWVSLGGSSAESSMLMIDASGMDKNKLDFTDVDINADVIEQAQAVTARAGLKPEATHLIVGSVIDEDLLKKQVGLKQADIVDMMGILEYFDDDQAVRLLQLAYGLLKPGGQILACNMRATHPQLALHKRGVGWPGVVPRSIDELLSLCRQVGIRPNDLSIYRPQDGVYNVFRIIRAR